MEYISIYIYTYTHLVTSVVIKDSDIELEKSWLNKETRYYLVIVVSISNNKCGTIV
jgi:hypothetical protein